MLPLPLFTAIKGRLHREQACNTEACCLPDSIWPNRLPTQKPPPFREPSRICIVQRQLSLQQISRQERRIYFFFNYKGLYGRGYGRMTFDSGIRLEMGDKSP
jgi:hypothetical protein